MNKIREWIKVMVSKLADLISRRFRRGASVGPELAPPGVTPLDKKLGREIQKRLAREGKAVDTRQGGPNMPKHQPCPNGHGWKRRKQKTMGGAYYGCQICGDFFVRAARL